VLGTVGATSTAGDARFLHEPAIGRERIVFVYADDLWTSKPDGSDVRRLTAHPGPEASPAISPDGKLVAFTGTYDGNPDVYVIGVDGGEPKRLTWHPGADVVCGFTPDGKVLFRSQRGVFTARYNQLFTVKPDGGVPEKEAPPNGFRAAVSPDGKYLAYTPLSEVFRQWKNYRGGTASRIAVLDRKSLEVEFIPQPEGRCNDTYPMWLGNKVYFLSDRDGEFNLYSYDRKSKSVTRLTTHEDFPIDSASAGAGKIAYEQAGQLWTFDPDGSADTRLKVEVAADLPETRPRFVSGAKYVRDFDISPTGKRAVVEFRGEIVTLPEKKGDVRYLTQTPGVHERSPVWSPDGKSIAFFSDAGGEYRLRVIPQDGKGEGKSHELKGSGFYERPVWSPDSKRIAFIDNSRTLYVIELDSGKTTKVASEPIYGPVNTMRFSWSPDSKWLAYTLTSKAYFQTLNLYSVSDDKSSKITDGLAEVGEPTFDPAGKYLYFLASTDAGPVKQWFDQSNADMQATYAIYMAVLAKKTPNPLLKESDEEGEKKRDKKDEEKGKKDEEEDKDKSEAKAKKPVEPIVLDLEGLENRIVPLPVPPGNLSNLQAGPEDKVYYVRRVGYVPGRNGDAFAGTPSLARFDLKKREEETLASKVDGFKLSADGKKLLYAAKDTFGIVEAGKFEPGKDKLDVAAISVRIEPRAEWEQIFNEAWRINRDYFYTPTMHGADWPAIKKKYAALLPDVPTRGDLNFLIRAMCSELAVGHSYLGGGDRLYENKSVPVGLLGADYEVKDNRYVFKKIYGGLTWDPDQKPPLVAPGVDVKPGEYLIAVDGKNVTADKEVYSYFENTVGRRVELTVAPKADGSNSRTLSVEPIDLGDEYSLRNRDWVEGNLRKVRERTGGRAAYVYVPNTAEMGHSYFKRYFFPQADKDAIIVDERFNGGGSVADYYIDILRRPTVSYWAMRHGEPIRTPGAAIMGPKVMLIDETAGSGGDLLPWMFRRFKLGTLVGKRTWGGLVGILGFPVLMDGGQVTAPDLAFYTDEGYKVENEGVPPDVEVEQMPADVAAGKDPQLDRAIDIILDELKRNPPKALEPPPAPVRVRRAK
jgi:tricorn protease